MDPTKNDNRVKGHLATQVNLSPAHIGNYGRPKSKDGLKGQFGFSAQFVVCRSRRCIYVLFLWLFLGVF